MRRLFIQQPYFFPWLGYFAKVARCDVVLFLDDCAFRRNHLHRTRLINSNGDVFYFTCPVGAKQGTPISRIYIPKEQFYIQKMRRSIAHSYGQMPHFRKEMVMIDALFRNATEMAGESLANFNITLIKMICDYMAIENKKMERESNFRLPQERTEKAIEAAKLLNCNTIIIGDGKAAEVHDFEKIIDSGLLIEKISYFEKHPIYKQNTSTSEGEAFVKGLSFIDALLCCGQEKTKKLINFIDAEPYGVNKK